MLVYTTLPLQILHGEQLCSAFKVVRLVERSLFYLR
jgi:hypothetical protein